jgi:alanine racemase
MKAATAYIDTQALQHNVQQLRQIAPNSKLLAVVKANAYGHGTWPLAEYLDDANGFGVARIEEALALRAHGIVKPILLLEGFYAPKDLPVLVTNNIHTALHSIEQLEALESSELEAPVHVWLKIDTGMHRLGVRPEEVETFISRLEACSNVVKPLRYISHLGCADDAVSPMTRQQIDAFLSMTHDHVGERSLSASAGTLAWPESQFEWVRPGIIMYGISPFEEHDRQADSYGMQPVMTLASSLIAVRTVKKGESVGYGGTWTSKRDTKVGVLAIGYGDGYPRSAPNGTPILLNGRVVPMAGRVSMDMMTVDLGPDATDKVGDEAILWGKGLPIEKVAAITGTITYELVTKLTSRVIRVYK